MPRRATSTSFGGIAGNPANRSGSIGRPDDAIRAKARESWGQRIARLEKIADGINRKDAAVAQASIAALREIRAVGFPDKHEHEHTGENGGPIQVWHFGDKPVRF